MQPGLFLIENQDEVYILLSFESDEGGRGGEGGGGGLISKEKKKKQRTVFAD